MGLCCHLFKTRHVCASVITHAALLRAGAQLAQNQNLQHETNHSESYMTLPPRATCMQPSFWQSQPPSQCQEVSQSTAPAWAARLGSTPLRIELPPWPTMRSVLWCGWKNTCMNKPLHPRCTPSSPPSLCRAALLVLGSAGFAAAQCAAGLYLDDSSACTACPQYTYVQALAAPPCLHGPTAPLRLAVSTGTRRGLATTLQTAWRAQQMPSPTAAEPTASAWLPMTCSSRAAAVTPLVSGCPRTHAGVL